MRTYIEKEFNKNSLKDLDIQEVGTYCDEDEIDNFFDNLMNCKKYNHFLIVVFEATWNKANGYKVTDDYMNCYYRSYDCSIYVTGSSRTGKYLKLKEFNHDCPCGHDTIIIGLTEREYNRIYNLNTDEIIDFGQKALDKIINI